MNDLEQRIREQAYWIWLDEGRPDGRAEAHWKKARELVADETNQRGAAEPDPATPGRGRTPRDRPAASPAFVESASTDAVETQGEVSTPTDQSRAPSAPKRRRRRS